MTSFLTSVQQIVSAPQARMFIAFVLLSTGLTHPASAQNFEPREFRQEKTEAPATYVVPNEFDNHLQFRELRRSPAPGKAVVIAVGTFRAFNALGVLERDALVAFDYAPGIAEFNRALAALIARVDRRELLHLLAGAAPGTIASGPAERESLRAHLLERKAAKTEFAELIAATGALTRAESDPALRTVLEHLRRAGRAGQNLWLNALLETTASPERFTATILGNERAYRHAGGVIANGRFVAVTGSLSGPEALGGIGDLLRARGLTVSELDVSNALEHVMANEGARGMEAFARNLARLPIQSSSRVLVTGYLRTTDHGDVHERLPTVGWWSYGQFDYGAFARLVPGLATEPALFAAYGKLAPVSCRRLFRH